MILVPGDAALEFYNMSTEDVQGTPYREIHFAIAKCLNLLKVSQAFSPSCVCNWNGAPLAQFFNKFLINAKL